ncbi:MAG: YibE/F family protein [Bacillota bacterium]
MKKTNKKKLLKEKLVKRQFLLCLIVVLLMSAYVSAEGINVLSSKAKVLSVTDGVLEEEQDEFDTQQTLKRNIQLIGVQVTSGKYQGRELFIQHEALEESLGKMTAKPGDRLIIDIIEEDGYFQSAHITDYQRDWFIYLLLAIFILVLLETAHLSGLKTLVSILLSFVLILKVLLPLVVQGYDPIFLTLVIALLVIMITMLLKNDNPDKSWSVVIGSSFGILVAAGLAFLATKLINLTGLSLDEIGVLWALTDGKLSFSGLFTAGIIISALGAVLHVAITIASSVDESFNDNPELSLKELYREGLNSTRDLAGNLSSTLIFTIMGLSLPLLVHLKANGEQLIKIINMDIVAGVLVIALAACIGLMVTIPITALTMAVFKTKVANRNLESGF